MEEQSNNNKKYSKKGDGGHLKFWIPLSIIILAVLQLRESNSIIDHHRVSFIDHRVASVNYYRVESNDLNSSENNDEDKIAAVNITTADIADNQMNASSFVSASPSPQLPLSCYKPSVARTMSLLDQNQIPVVQVSKPILNMGMPKVGSTSLHQFFTCANMSSSHWRCEGLKTFCGKCMQKANQLGLPPLASCGNYDVFTQMDISSGKDRCYFPQVELLQQIHDESPNATFILPFRDVDRWYDSVRTFHYLHRRISSFCKFTDYPYGINMTREGIKQLFCDQVNRVRSFVEEHPSHTLIEIDIEDNINTPLILGNLFDVNSTQCWGNYNQNFNSRTKSVTH